MSIIQSINDILEFINNYEHAGQWIIVIQERKIEGTIFPKEKMNNDTEENKI